MTKITKIGCLHAHHSNIGYIEQALAARSDGIELTHYVDPGLVGRLSSDASYTADEGRKKVAEQLEWIAEGGADAILITCTNYAALLPEDRSGVAIPIVTIDEPFFGEVCRRKGRQLLLFTNPATVEGTMVRLREYAKMAGLCPDVEARLIPGTFELIMQGKKEEYEQALTGYIRDLSNDVEDGSCILSVAQLSMVGAARALGEERAASGASAIGNPLDPLAAHVEERILRG
ncbi:aspartate/glutamate racemase family protein [Cohnella suwonensis]|uniref:Aspartate/glutamate racemase family protein n=1 Tax=Cohnella suwonensis TaxID=696072 RepID=A0ABW0M5M7_9BACL